MLSDISKKESLDSIQNYQNELRKCKDETSSYSLNRIKLQRIEKDLKEQTILFSLSDVAILIEKTILNDMRGHPYHEINPNGRYQDNFPRKMLLLREYQKLANNESSGRGTNGLFQTIEGV